MRVESWTRRPGAAMTVTVKFCETGRAIEIRRGHGERSAADLVAGDEQFRAADGRVGDRGIIAHHGKGQGRNLGDLGNRDEVRDLDRIRGRVIAQR